MTEYERKMRKKRYTRRKRKAVIVVSLGTFLLAFGFILGGTLYRFANHNVKAVSVNKNAPNIEYSKESKKNIENINAGDNKTAVDNRENKVPENIVVLSDQVNPYKADGEKVAFLTFDDGPSKEVTPRVLDILNKYGVKATFFVTGYMVEKNSDILIREWSEHDAIGNHSYSHRYKYLYSSTNNFVNDIEKCNNIIKSVIGNEYKTKLIRFPGGSFGNRLIPYRNAITKAGYHYVDWNALNGDAEYNNVPEEKLIERLKETSKEKEHIVVLMHDAPSKETTVQALPQIIEYLQAQGYKFKVLR